MHQPLAYARSFSEQNNKHTPCGPNASALPSVVYTPSHQPCGHHAQYMYMLQHAGHNHCMPCSATTLDCPNHWRNTQHLPSTGVHGRQHDAAAALLVTLRISPHSWRAQHHKLLACSLHNCLDSPQRSLLVHDHSLCLAPGVQATSCWRDKLCFFCALTSVPGVLAVPTLSSQVAGRAAGYCPDRKESSELLNDGR